MVRIAGSLLNGLLQSFQSIHALTGHDAQDLVGESLSNDEWRDFETFENIIERVKEKNSDIKGLLFRAGIEFIKGWYHFGGGSDLVNSPIDFLKIQTDSRGYAMVVQGDEPDEAGWVKMTALDENLGEASVSSTVPFPIDFTRGVFVGGMHLLGGIDFLDVNIQEVPSTIEGFYASDMQLKFLTTKEIKPDAIAAIEKGQSIEGSAELTSAYYWKYKGLQKQIENEKIYRDQLNNILIKTTEDLQEKNRSLGALLKELQSTQDQLIQQEKMASLGQLTAGVAHEINNPMNFVANNAQVLDLDLQDLEVIFKLLIDLKSSEEKDKIHALLDEVKKLELPNLVGEMKHLTSSIKGGSQRITKIVKSLQYLSFSDQENKELTNIAQPIDATLVILNNKLGDRIRIETALSECPEIMVNPAQINQVLLNILNNAIQAIDEEGIIKLSTSYDKEYLTIQIEDNGAGMSVGTKTRIFEPFFTTKKIGEGTGLGLSISYGIIQAHKGNISVESELEKGTVFTIKLPY